MLGFRGQDFERLSNWGRRHGQPAFERSIALCWYFWKVVTPACSRVCQQLSIIHRSRQKEEQNSRKRSQFVRPADQTTLNSMIPFARKAVLQKADLRTLQLQKLVSRASSRLKGVDSFFPSHRPAQAAWQFPMQLCKFA